MMKEYYRERAPYYDKIYQTPEWQDDLATLRNWIAESTRGRTVLEVAAGTGYWTEAVATTATAVTATDCNAAMLAYAKRRKLGPHVTLCEADAFALPKLSSRPDVGMAHLWWSHVEKLRQRDFLAELASRLREAATILITDQVYLPGYSHPAFRRDRFGNRYELRTLDNGEIHQIVKNYPTAAELEQSFASISSEVEIHFMRYFWRLRAKLRTS